MPAARYWGGKRIVLAWVIALAGLGIFRWTLQAGTYRAALEDQRVLRVGGLWPSSFATLMTFVGVAVAIAILGWMTGSWYAGRKERAARRVAAKAGHRRVLM